MCLGIPMRVIACDMVSAQCEARGQRREVTLLLLQGERPAPGDWVLVSAGNAVRRLEEAIDNGLTFHHHEKLRTVLWGFAGRRQGQCPFEDCRGL